MAPSPSIQALLGALTSRMPLEKAAAWDPVGLELGDPERAVGSVAVCHEVTEAVVDALEAEPADLVIGYHPLLFEPTQRLLAGRTPTGRAFRLVRAGIALASVHTAFDVCAGGAADALAEALGLEDPTGFGPLTGPDAIKIATFVPAEAADKVLDAVAAAGAGRIGAYTHCSFRSEGLGSFFAGIGTQPVVGEGGALNTEPEVRIEFPAPRSAEAAVVTALLAAHPYEEPAYDVYERRGGAGLIGRIGRVPGGTTLGDLAERARGALGAPPLRVAGERDAALTNVAVVPGSGGDFIAQARAAGADALVTGDVSHHRARAALDRGLALVDVGHAAGERPGVVRLFEWVEALGTPTRSLLDCDPDPWV